MLFSATPLSHYCQAVATFPYPATWEQLATIRPDAASRWLILVSDRQRPVGAIAYNCLAVGLWERSQALSMPQPTVLSRTASFRAEIPPQLIESFQTFPAQTSVAEFLAQRPSFDRVPYGLVDGDGRFLGLVNSWQMLEDIARSSEESTTQWAINPQLGEWLDRLSVPLQVQNAEGIVTYQNRLWQQEIGASILTLGCEPKQTLKQLDEALPCPEVAAQLSCSQWLEYRSQLSQGRALLQRSPLKERRIWRFTKCPLPNKAGWLTLALDVTAFQKNIEVLGAQNKEIVHLNSLKDGFLEHICHELKSPSTSLVGLANLLLGGSIGALSDRQTQYVELLLQSGRKIAAQVNELRDLVESASLPTETNWTTVSLRNLCQSVLQLVQDKYPTRPLPTLAIAEDGDNWLTDVPLLRRILFSLLDYVMRSTSPTTSCQLTIERWQQGFGITIGATGDLATDLTGHRLESEEAVKLQDLGFGVVLAQQGLRALGGELRWFKGDRSDVFQVILPVCQPSTESERLSERAWVLVADTQLDRIEALRSLLKPMGYGLWAVNSGLTAIEQARYLQPHAIFLHPELPQLSGWDVLTLLKSATSTRAIPVVLINDGWERPQVLPFAEDFTLSPPFHSDDLQPIFQPTPQRDRLPRSLRILQLCPESNFDTQTHLNRQFVFDLNWVGQLSQFNHRILEADDLEQAEMLSQVWEIDVVVLDGRALEYPDRYLAHLEDCPGLMALPWVVLDANTATAANLITDLTVFPCLLSNANPNLDRFWQVLQVATGMVEENHAMSGLSLNGKNGAYLEPN
jgi:signal transduction histidine kinase/CheY-like chemotaxis protein